MSLDKKELNNSADLEAEKLNRTLMEHIILGVAHEINNPNTFVRMNAATLKKMISMIGRCLDEYDQNHTDEKFGPYSLSELRSKMIQLTDSILDATVRIIAVADKLKQCSSFALSKASPVSISQLIERIVTMHKFLIDKVGRVEITTNGEPHFIEGFSLQLEQAFSILITNACDAIAERFTDPDNKQGFFKISITDQNDSVRLEFEDNGTGMDAEVQSKIFTPYFTTKPQGVGDGLGMPLCLAIINRHYGQLTLKSEKGQGTVFSIVLPKKLEHESAANGESA